MDKQILRAIVKSHEEVTKDLKNQKYFEESLNDEKFPITEHNVLTALTRSFTDLLSYKVSPEASQRYSVRIQVIEILRDWISVPKELESWKTFSQVERVLELIERILKIYTTENVLLSRGEKRVDLLVNIANALITLSRQNKKFLIHSKRLLNGIAVLKTTENSRRLLLNAVEEKDRLDLDLSTIERLYIAQRLELVEEPIINNIIDNLKDTEAIKSTKSFKTCHDVEKLLKIAAISPTIFQIVSSVLKEIFLHSNYSPKILRYICFFLESLYSHCKEANKNILDLYPLHLQSRIILLDIEPERHTMNSRIYVLDCLDETHRSSPDEALILLLHFPKWSKLFSERLTNYSNVDESFNSMNAFMHN